MAKLIALIIAVIALIAGVIIGVKEGSHEGMLAGLLIWAFFGGLEFAVISFSQQRSLKEIRRDLDKLKKETEQSH